jgi:hypothetical protein
MFSNAYHVPDSGYEIYIYFNSNKNAKGRFKFYPYYTHMKTKNLHLV